MSRKDKKRAQRCHARKRALERYGIEYTKEMRDLMIKQIRASDFHSAERQSLRVSVYTMTFEGKLLRIVYDKQRKEIVTFLPLEAVTA